MLFLSLRIFYIVTTVVVASVNANAQSALFGVDTGRYEVRPSTKVEKTKAIETKKSRSPASEVIVEAIVNPAPPSDEQLNNKNSNAQVEKTEPGIGTQVESMFDSRFRDVLSFYKNNIDQEDIRNNRVEAELMPQLTYLDAQSNYSYRHYTTQYVSLGIKTSAWFTPRFGIFGSFVTSLAGELDTGNSSRSKTSAKFESLDTGISFRSFDGLSKNSSSTEFIIKLLNSRLSVSSDETSRASLRSTGLGLGFKMRLPTESHYNWIVGGTLYPKVNHSESATTGAGQSGGRGESVKLDFELGGEIEAHRRSQFLWIVGYGFERNTFTGSPGIGDPQNGASPKNVGVTTTALSFGLGYRWGR